MNLGAAILRNSVRPRTGRTYSTAARRWFTVAEKIGTNPTMTVIPDAWNHRHDDLADSSITWPEACMVVYLVTSTQPGYELTPQSASVYLSGVRKFLEWEGVDTKFMDNSQYLRNTKQGLAQHYRLTANTTTGDRERIPVTVDMITTYHRATSNGRPDLPQQAVYTAMLIGYTMVARVSEYLETPDDTSHLLTTERIMFETLQGATIPAHDAYKHCDAHIVAVTVNIKSKKNDQKGRGYKYHFTLARPGDKYCITQELWHYATRAKPAKGRSFFFIPTLNWTLKPPYFAQQLKRLAIINGLDATRVSSHSLRIGGASTLAAAGLTGPEIKNMGDWKSNAYLKYVRKTLRLFDKARRALASPDALSIKDIRRMHTTS